MEVWSGSVKTLSNYNLQGVRLIDASSTGHADIAKNAKLFVRAFVNPALVPLYCQTGPILEVHVTNGDTAAWLRDRLLPDTWIISEQQDRLHESQCPTAVLLRIEEPNTRGNRNAKDAWEKVTDILVYGILTRSPEGHSSPSSNSGDGNCNMNLRIYAVSLCSGREAKVQALPTPPQSPGPEDVTREGEGMAEFLPDMTSPSPKRKRVATLFDAATEFHKKAQRRGGIGISEFGKKEAFQKSKDYPFMRLRRDRDNAQSQSSNMSQGASQPPSAVKGNDRPASPSLPEMTTVGRPRAKSISSRRGTPGYFPKEAADSAVGNTSHPSSTAQKPACCDETMSANKTLLTRTILTSMRLYGYRRSAKPSARPTTPATPFPEPMPNADAVVTGDIETQKQAMSETDEDEEFKAMYHATYRASTFALRQFLKPCEACAVQAQEPAASAGCISSLGRDRTVHVVDSILKIFCEGPG